jgi:hypothetical protein
VLSADVVHWFVARLFSLPISSSTGGVSGTVADPKLIFAAPIYGASAAIILSHNHLSGQLKPSDADLKLTQKLKEGGKYLEIRKQTTEKVVPKIYLLYECIVSCNSISIWYKIAKKYEGWLCTG